jgi:predicted RNA polymerase sigma factor
LRAGLALAPAAAGKYPLDEAGCHRALAELLATTGSKAEARSEFERAIALYRAVKSSGIWLERAQAGLTKLLSLP